MARGSPPVGSGLFMTIGATLKIAFAGTMAGNGYSQLDILRWVNLDGETWRNRRSEGDFYLGTRLPRMMRATPVRI